MLQLELIKSLSEVTGLDSGHLERLLVRTRDLAFGDWAFPCFGLSKSMQASPPECARQVAEKIKLPDGIAKAEAVGAYVNFFYDRSYLAKKTIGEILRSKLEFGKKAKNGKCIVIDYSSPNIAKTLHVGHLRTTLIGLALDRLFEYLGYKVVSVNHLGDWGTQFGYVWVGCKLWGVPEKPSVDSLVDMYIKASALRKVQEGGNIPEADQDKPDVTAMAREYFISLEAGEKEAIAFWQWCVEVSIESFKECYTRLGIDFDYYTGESFYHKMLPEVEDQIRRSGILEDSRGALGVDLGKELGFVRVFAEDGRSLYLTRDIAAAIYRNKTFNPEIILYVVAAQQTLHFKQLAQIMKKLGDPVGDKIIHVPFGFVPGMKTREGGGISLRGFLDEAHQRALSAYREEVQKRPEGLNEEEVAEAVAIGATYFYFLSHSNAKDFQFSWKEALTFQGDSGPYVQYALARINSIESKAQEVGIVADESFNPDLFTGNVEHELVSLLSQFEETLQKSATDYEPHHIALYCLDLARCISKTYRLLRVVGEEQELAKSRLALFIACRNVLYVGLTLIGVPPIERM